MKCLLFGLMDKEDFLLDQGSIKDTWIVDKDKSFCKEHDITKE
jgi:hypothetical protein